MMILASSTSAVIKPIPSSFLSALQRYGYPDIEGDYMEHLHSTGYNTGSGYTQSSGWSTDAEINAGPLINGILSVNFVVA